MDYFLFRKVFITYFCHEFTLILKSNWRDLNSRLWAAGYVHQRFIVQIFWKIKKEKDWSDPQPDSYMIKIWRLEHTIATPYGARLLRAPYMIKISGLEHLTASKQPGAIGGLLDISEERSGGCSDYLKYSKMLLQVLDACRTRLRRARGSSDPGQRDCLQA